jgi:hypothetical protein
MKKKIGRPRGSYQYPMSEILIGLHPQMQSQQILQRLFIEGYRERKCYKCGITHWNKEEAPLELHHKNGNPRDHRDENLDVLCPNCHSQTDFHRGKKTKGKKRGPCKKTREKNALLLKEAA